MEEEDAAAHYGWRSITIEHSQTKQGDRQKDSQTQEEDHSASPRNNKQLKLIPFNPAPAIFL